MDLFQELSGYDSRVGIGLFINSYGVIGQVVEERELAVPVHNIRGILGERQQQNNSQFPLPCSTAVQLGINSVLLQPHQPGTVVQNFVVVLQHLFHILPVRLRNQGQTVLERVFRGPEAIVGRDLLKMFHIERRSSLFDTETTKWIQIEAKFSFFFLKKIFFLTFVHINNSIIW